LLSWVLDIFPSACRFLAEKSRVNRALSSAIKPEEELPSAWDLERMFACPRAFDRSYTLYLHHHYNFNWTHPTALAGDFFCPVDFLQRLTLSERDN